MWLLVSESKITLVNNMLSNPGFLLPSLGVFYMCIYKKSLYVFISAVYYP